jgi:hypothetical protein
MDKRLNENPIIKGDIAEKMFELECIKRGISIYKPVNSSTREDFIIVKDGAYKKVQIKYISAYKGHTIQVSFMKCQNGRKVEGKQMYLKYNEDEVDLLYVYCPDSNQWYEVPVSIATEHRAITLRLTTPSNNQTKGVRFADDYIW